MYGEVFLKTSRSRLSRNMIMHSHSLYRFSVIQSESSGVELVMRALSISFIQRYLDDVPNKHSAWEINGNELRPLSHGCDITQLISK